MTGGVLFTSSICVIQAARTEEHSLQHRCIMGERYQFLSQLFSPCGMSSRWPQTLPSRYGLYGSSFLAIAFVGSPVNPSDEILHRWNLYVTACSKTSTWTRWQRSVRQYSHDSRGSVFFSLDRLFKTALKSLNRTSLFFAMCLCVPSGTGI